MSDIGQFETFCESAIRQPKTPMRWRRPHVPLTRAEVSGLGYEPVLTKVGKTELAFAPAAGPFAPVVAAAGLIHILLGKIFGPDPKNVPAAQSEQTFEAAAINALNVAKAGMAGSADAIAFMQSLIAQGTAYIQSSKLGDAGNRAIKNMTSVIQAQISATSSLPKSASQAVDLAKAHSLYVGGAGWYAQSTAAAAQITDQWLASLSAPPLGGGALTSSLASLSASPLVWVALLAGGLLLWRGGL